MNAISQSGINALKQFELSGNEKKMERHAHIAAIRTQMKRMDTAGRDQLVELFNQTLMELEEATGGASARPKTANDEMVLRMQDKVKTLKPDQKSIENIALITSGAVGAQLQMGEELQAQLDDFISALLKHADETMGSDEK